MSEDLTALAQDVRRSAQLVRDLKAESETIKARLIEINGDDGGTEQGQLHFAEIALEDARKRLEGTEDEPATQGYAERQNEDGMTSLEKELDHAVSVETSAAGNHNGSGPFVSDY